MAYTGMQWASTTYVTGETLSNAINLTRPYDFIQLDIPAVNNCTFGVMVSRTAGGTYNAFSAANVCVPVNVSTGSRQERLAIGGHQFLKLVSSVVQDVPVIYYRGIAV